MRKAAATFSGVIVNSLIYIVVILVIFKAGTYAYSFSYEVFGDPVVSEYSTETQTVTIKSGDTTRKLAADLKSKGLIKHEQAFVIKARLENANIMPGDYEISKSMSADQMLEAFTAVGSGAGSQKEDGLSSSGTVTTSETASETTADDEAGEADNADAVE